MQVAALEGYRIWAASYDTIPNPLLALERRALANVLRPVYGSSVIDVACGTGYWTRRAEETGAIAFGFDLCREMIERAQQKSVSGGLFFVADASAIPVRSGTADLTLCSLAASYFPDLRRAMSEIARVTRTGGRVIVSDMHPSASAAGWNRSFRAGGTTYEIEHRQWSDDCFRAAGADAGLQEIEHFDEAFAEPERALFAAAGREHLFTEVRRIPAIRITTWIRL
jgi:SAM-dependent methyltransferase